MKSATQNFPLYNRFQTLSNPISVLFPFLPFSSFFSLISCWNLSFFLLLFIYKVVPDFFLFSIFG